jgi:sec-independent protein translocase protein TatA
LAFDATELIVIAVIAIVIFLWGPQKIPELARGLGRAKREFDTASKEITGAVTSAPLTTRPTSGDELLIKTARQLGISTEGKTREQISEEIVAKGQK